MMSFLKLAAYFVRALVTSIDLPEITEYGTEVYDLIRKMRYFNIFGTF